MGDSSLDGRERLEKLRERLAELREKHSSDQDVPPQPPEGFQSSDGSSSKLDAFFESAKEFRREIMGFFEVTWPKIAPSMVDRINDNFETLKSVPSS